MRVLVCGGRDYNNQQFVNYTLHGIHETHTIEYLINGGARGADSLGARWAQANGINCLTYPAKWSEHGKAAGPIRNQRMIDEGKPDLVVAFPGGKGTADMVKRAKSAGIKVTEVK